MSAPVDVLKVLREYAQDTGSFRVTNQAATRLAAACAAMAELIAADKEYDRVRCPANGCSIGDVMAASRRRAIAIAGCAQ